MFDTTKLSKSPNKSVMQPIGLVWGNKTNTQSNESNINIMRSIIRDTPYYHVRYGRMVLNSIRRLRGNIISDKQRT